MAAIEVRDLTKRYGRFTALDRLSLSVEPGQIVGLMGENGSGKTTLLKILAGVLADYEGDVRVAGHRPGPASKARVSYLPDASFLPDGSTGNYAISLYRDFFADFDEAKARGMIEFFGLEPTQPLKAMSKGMREKLQIALAMSRRASVYLLDEPISGVDPAARDVIMSGMLRDFSPDGLLVISTHLIHDIEPLVDSVIFIRQGRVLLSGVADDLREEYGVSLDSIFRKVYAPCSLA